MDDPYDLNRFVKAQAPFYEQAVRELLRGRKMTHWMWFIFPQLEGLGSSIPARRYAITSVDEARAYLAHPVLGPRLKECACILLGHQGRTAEQIFGRTDMLKLRSSMTLFALASKQRSVFREVLDRYYNGKSDSLTLDRVPQAA
ncbi:DUF1810 domain-containing protein [Rhizobium halophytocola]|uniref:Uncharacterized protein (DUF1810 family) n=1 Tax=Rhizobium halophytocola TaxID=735519 RepID=A0ABS4DZA8_9HYPH|nr:DUF1810 domain-containing protein [Rhizobium halophytocola]MBP1851020.1 uncharacterized protein (DUF1810 family) [Rhizobium halophytocola]